MPSKTGTDILDTQTSKQKLIDLIQRSLAITHKLKVHDSQPPPQSHEEIATYRYSRWELEDELSAIEQLIAESRQENVKKIRDEIRKKGVKKKKLFPNDTKLNLDH